MTTCAHVRTAAAEGKVKVKAKALATRVKAAQGVSVSFSFRFRFRVSEGKGWVGKQLARAEPERARGGGRGSPAGAGVKGPLPVECWIKWDTLKIKARGARLRVAIAGGSPGARVHRQHGVVLHGHERARQGALPPRQLRQAVALGERDEPQRQVVELRVLARPAGHTGERNHNHHHTRQRSVTTRPTVTR